MSDFSGGLNLRDSLSELADNESPYLKNVVFDERGGVLARLGMSRLNGASALPAAAAYLYYSAVADAVLAYISTHSGAGKLYKSLDGGTTWSAAYSTFTAGAQGAIVDFNGSVYVVNTIDGVYAFPAGLGAPTHTAGGTANMEAVRGSCIAAWQNKLWVGGDSNNRSRMWRSNAGDGTKWTIATDWTDHREIDDEIITAVGVGQGVDAQNKPALFVAKLHSCYRVNDSGTGAFTTLHSGGAGAASSRAVASVLGLIVFINDRGVWVTDGIGIPRRVSDTLAPLFSPAGVNVGAQSTWSAAAKFASDTVVFAITRSGQSTPDQLLEYHPGVGWFTRHTFGVGVMCPYTKSTKKLIGTDSNGVKVFEMFKGGLDDGSPYLAEWQSRWFELAGGLNATLRGIRGWGRGTVNFAVLTDFTLGQGSVLSGLDWSTLTGGIWDTDTWDGSLVFGESLYESDNDIPLDEVGRYFSIKVGASVHASAAAPPVLGDGSAPETGPWALYEMLLRFVPRS